jgi:hypothetical protein
MLIRNRLICATASLVGLLPSLGCISTKHSCNDYALDQGCESALGGTSGAGGNSSKGGATNSGGGDSTGGTGGSASSSTPTCDTSKSPKDASCLVASAYAIFVSPTGDDSASGTKDKPVNTIAKALSLASTKKFVIACSGTYTDALSLTKQAKIYGSFDCKNAWKYDTSKPTTVAPTTPEPSLSINAGSASVVIEDVQFEAVDAVTAGSSSIAAFVKDSANVTLRRVSLTAGNGAAGASAALSPYTYADASALIGNAGQQYGGGLAVPCTCPNTTTTTRGAGGAPDGAGTSGKPTYDATGGLGGDTTKDCGLGGSGLPGTDAPVSTIATGALSYGTFNNDTWTPSAGTDGEDGKPGQGGGGGAGKATGGGGSGACGGCGGKGGPGGQGGGASIALLSLNSTISLEASTLITGNGGNGASGIVGQEGQLGGTRGKGFVDGCDGGNGGKGATGATGGGGVGGLSVAVFYSGTIPSIDKNTKTTLGQPGTGGKGGDDNATTDDGINGKATNTLIIP